MGGPGCPRPVRARPAPTCAQPSAHRAVPVLRGGVRAAAAEPQLPPGLRGPAPPASTPPRTGSGRQAFAKPRVTARSPHQESRRQAGTGRGSRHPASRVPRPAWRRRISSRDSLTPAGGGKHFVATRWPSPPLPRRPSPALRPAAPARCPGPGLSSAPRRLAGPPEPVLAGSRVLAAAEGPSCCADPLTRASFPRILRRLLRCLLAPHVPADENLVSSRETLAVFCRCQKGRFPFLKPRTLVAEGRRRRVRGRPP